MTGAPLWKPSPLEVAERKAQRKVSRRAAKLALERAEREYQQAIRLQVFIRDGFRCRACDALVKLYSDNPLTVGHAHHVVYRSAGGSDELHNRLLLCAYCHDREHRHLLRITGTPDATVTFEQFNPETGRLLRTWESTVG